MAAGLRGHAPAGVAENDRKIGDPCARRHVARVLLVTRYVGDDERAFAASGFGEQAADQRGLAVARATADDDAEAVLRGIAGLRFKRVETAEAFLIRHGSLFWLLRF